MGNMPLLAHGDRIGPYLIGQLIGVGGMSEVYRAVKVGPHGLRRPFAVKVMLIDEEDRAERFELFEAEVRVASQLHHANLVPVLDCGVRLDGLMWLAEELVDGIDLGRLCREGPLPMSVALFVMTELLRALKYVHEHPLRLVHQDVKPSNILIGRDGSVRLTDFGIAEPSSTLDATTKGSPAYMSPEQAHADGPATERTDLFGAGLVLWEMLTGRPLCAETERREQLYRGQVPSLRDEVLGVSPRVERLLEWLLHVDPTRRCPCAESAIRMIATLPNARVAGARELEGIVARALDPVELIAVGA